MEIEEAKYSVVVPQKSPNDERNYEALQLNNGLKIVFVEDPTLQKSVCSISVGVGSLAEYDRSLGLAHFLEHMLFMGSKKFPIHNEYSSFINSNSGMDNAYTSDVETNYYFEIANKSYIQAVERITNFFTGALLTESCITKERQAVHQQYVLWTNDDNCRKWQILRKLAKGPYQRFSIGNQETLGHQQIRNDLVKFYQSQYSSNRINAVLISNISIPQMKKQLLHFFQEIPNKNLQKHHFDQSFSNENVGKLIRMQSIKQQTIMEFFWPIQSLKQKYKKHADEYITHILGHEGKNSLFSYLKTKGYASTISSYSHDIANQTIIGLEIKLTQQGAHHYEQVYNIVIDYTSSLKADRHIFEQIKNKKQISWRFKQKTQNYNYACNLSSKMHDIEKLEEILKFKNIFEEYDPDFLERVLKQLNPFTLIVVFSNSEEIEGAITEKYLNGKYLVQGLPERKVYVKQFDSLAQNPFLPVNIELKPENEDKLVPCKIASHISFLKDNHFKVCKGGVNIILHGLHDPTLKQFYTQYLNLLLKEITYDAETLNLQIDYDFEDSINIEIFGFNDTVFKLVHKIGQNLLPLHRSENSSKFFTIALDKLIEDYENFYCGEVDQILETALDNILIDENIDIPESIEILESYQYENITQKLENFITSCSLSWTFVGNFEEKQILTLTHEFQQNLKCSKNTEDKAIRCLRVQNSIKHLTPLTSEQISTSGCIVYYEAGEYSEKLYYTLQLLKNYIEEPFFNSLRTEKQLAYYLATRVINNRGVLGIEFILVSSTKDPYYISKQIKSFVEEFMGKIEVDVTEQKINELKESVKTKFIVPHNNLKSLFNFINKQITHSTYYFNRKEKSELDNHFNLISTKDLVQSWNFMKPNCLQLHVLAKNHEQEFNKCNVSSEYTTLNEVKGKGSFHEDIFQKRRIN